MVDECSVQLPLIENQLEIVFNCSVNLIHLLSD
jgi:hypothetical protein